MRKIAKYSYLNEGSDGKEVKFNQPSYRSSNWWKYKEDSVQISHRSGISSLHRLRNRVFIIIAYQEWNKSRNIKC